MTLVGQMEREKNKTKLRSPNGPTEGTSASRVPKTYRAPSTGALRLKSAPNLLMYSVPAGRCSTGGGETHTPAPQRSGGENPSESRRVATAP